MKLTIGKQEIEVKDLEIEHSKLKFYAENPRVYTALQVSDDAKPEQAAIQEIMCKMEHVKQLKSSIESNGGLIDPVIVRDGDYVVLEGNSRLAAYRLLSRQDPFKWGHIKCYLLPSNIDDSLVFQLLGQYHIIGRKDWSPFEQAGYLYRRRKESKLPIEKMAEDLGLTKGVANKYIEVYEAMIKANDLIPSQWSYYEEFNKNRPIKRMIEEEPEIKEILVNKIKSGDIKQASDIRKIGEITACNAKPAKKALRKFIEGCCTLEEAYVEFQDTGKSDTFYKKAKAFNEMINEKDFTIKLEDKALNFEITRIYKKLHLLLKN